MPSDDHQALPNPTPIVRHAPKICGVEMFEQSHDWYVLRGCSVQKACTQGWVGEVFLDGKQMHFRICDTPEVAAKSCEGVVVRIRQLANELGAK